MALPKPAHRVTSILQQRAVLAPVSQVFLRKLTARDVALYQDHLLRLSHTDRCNRFMGTVGDERVRSYCSGLNWSSTTVLGAFVDGELRGVGELARASGLPRPIAEIALSVEQAWQNQGIGSLLLRHVLTMARNRYMSRVFMMCLVDNRKMQKIARKFDANLIFENGGVEGTLWPYWPNYRSLLEEATADGRAFFNAIVGQAPPTRH